MAGDNGGNAGATFRQWWPIIALALATVFGWGIAWNRVETKFLLLEVEMKPVCARMDELEEAQESAELDRRILEKKIDRLLIEKGIDPEAVR